MCLNYETSVATYSSDRTCGEHRVCKSGEGGKYEYMTEAPGHFHDRQCACCEKGHRCDGNLAAPVECRNTWTNTPTDEDATTVEKRNSQPADYALAMFQNQRCKNQCKFCQDCPAEQVRTGCDFKSAGQCRTCQDGTIKDNYFTCATCQCGHKEVDHTTCEPCSPGYFAANAKSDSCAACQPPNYQPGSGKCGCLTCNGYVHRNAATPLYQNPHKDGMTHCTAHTTCAADEYECQAPTHTTDRKCCKLKVCSDKQYVAKSGDWE